MHKIIDYLKENKDKQYAEFSKKIIPDTKYEIIGVRTPKLKQLAKEVVKDSQLFLSFINDKHTYHEEFILHGLLLGEYKESISKTLIFLTKFIPHIDNWAVCDSTVSALKIFKTNKKCVFNFTEKIINSKHPYSVRFAVVTLLWYFLDDEYFDNSIRLINKVIFSDNYYVNMSIAWFFSIALIKNYDKTIFYLENKTLPKFIHNKTIQKCIDSFRVTNQIKKHLSALKI